MDYKWLVTSVPSGKTLEGLDHICVPVILITNPLSVSFLVVNDRLLEPRAGHDVMFGG